MCTNRSRTQRSVMDTTKPPCPRILSYWRATTPLWYAQQVEGRRRDILVVDDSNIGFDGYGSREHAIAMLTCDRRVFIIRPGDGHLRSLRERYRLDAVATARVEVPGSGIVERPIDEVGTVGGAECAAVPRSRSSKPLDSSRTRPAARATCPPIAPASRTVSRRSPAPDASSGRAPGGGPLTLFRQLSLRSLLARVAAAVAVIHRPCRYVPACAGPGMRGSGDARRPRLTGPRRVPAVDR